MDGPLTFSMRPSLWRRLAEAAKPLVLYGMGDGADKIIACLQSVGRQPQGVFASDDFVRGQTFRNWQVESLSAAEQRLGELCVLVCFGTERPEVLAQIYGIAKRHEAYAPHVPLFGEALFDEAFLAAHREELCEVDNLWADSESRAVYRNYLAYMWSGDFFCLKQAESSRAAAWQLLNIGADEVCWDLGAYDGDTVKNFVRLTGGRYREVLAIEPDAKNFRKLSAALAGLEHTEALPYAVWSKSGEIRFAGKAGRNSAVAAEDFAKAQTVRAVSLDDLAAGGRAVPTVIKFDVEGAEEAALEGAANLLRVHRPKLALAAYHRTEDIYRLPLLLKRLNPAYRLYLRHHPYVPGWETNIYAC